MQPLNYTTHLIEDLYRSFFPTAELFFNHPIIESLKESMREDIATNPSPEKRQHTKWMLEELETDIRKDYNEEIQSLKSAIKFMGPMNGRFLHAETDQARDKLLDFWHLPYKNMVLEYPGDESNSAPADLLTEDYRQTVATRTLLHAVEIDHDVDGELIRGALISSAYWNRLNGFWVMPPIRLFVPYDAKYLRQEHDGHKAIMATTQNFSGKALIMMVASDGTIEALQENDTDKFLDSLGKREPYMSGMAQKIWDESISLRELCAVLNCSNVTIDKVDPSEKLNRKRSKSGKTPFFEYKVLMVGIGPKEVYHSGVKMGDRASPRQHLRRGHIRHYQSGKTVWINSMVVGKLSDGMIVKDYAVRT